MKKNEIRKPDTEQTGVKMGPRLKLAIFPAHVETNRPATLAEPFHKILEMLVIERTVSREKLVAVRQGDEMIGLMHLGLMHTAHRPLSRPL